METTISHDRNVFQQMAPAWERLLQSAVTRTPFQSHVYLWNWWLSSGGGEWQNPELWLIKTQSEHELIGVAPFFCIQDQHGEQTLAFIGSQEISDYLDIISSAENHAVFVEEIFSLLAQSAGSEWAKLDLYNIPAGSPTLSAFVKSAKKRGWQISIEDGEPCPYISLPAEWEIYLQKLSKKKRHEIRRKIRRFEEQVPNASLYITSTADDMDVEARKLLQLMAKDPKKELFLTPEMHNHFLELIKAGHTAGWLQIVFLKNEDQYLAAFLNFDYQNKIWVYNSGIDPDYYSLSPGWVLLAYLIQWAQEKGRAELDFMRGTETYKYRFGAKDGRIQRLIIRP